MCVCAWTIDAGPGQTVDAVILCAPLTDETRGAFGAAGLALLRDGASLVNVARGELVDTDALVREVASSVSPGHVSSEGR
ncbi:hypothetical protein C6Y14_12350 [Streptomyces dioscori]|uniref:D-isomer specific 2-hydroxyacid dehydrogenase NAD-binding domain-containing protein n=1 Tax=Streptomyces dioscori TaxID=2109333 RepID=A0A2P8Q9P6_9ACTN|nr:hypothetical protein C6Y14_12350 [Streptomyces dioscori]